MTPGPATSAVLFVERLYNRLLEPVGLRHVSTLGGRVDLSLGHDRLLLFERVGLGHGLVSIHAAIMPR